MTHTVGKFSAVGATIVLNDEEKTEVYVETGDLVSNLVVAAGNYGTTEEMIIPSGNIVGFVPKPIDVRRGATRSYDGVPMRMRDANGGQYRGFVQEVLEVRDLIVHAPTNEGEDLIRVNVDNIVSIETDEG